MIPRKQIGLYRKQGGEYVDGLWVEGTEQALTIQASVQPASPEDMERLPEGRRQQRAYRLYTDSDLHTVDDQNPDQVELFSERYEVMAVDRWDNGLIPHNAALVLRMEEQS